MKDTQYGLSGALLTLREYDECFLKRSTESMGRMEIRPRANFYLYVEVQFISGNSPSGGQIWYHVEIRLPLEWGDFPLKSGISPQDSSGANSPLKIVESEFPPDRANFKFPSLILALCSSQKRYYKSQGWALSIIYVVSNISVGVVATDIWIEDIRTFVAEFPFLEPRTIADAILYALNTPPNVEITEFTIKPLGERF
uniref:Uncharacterized protein n=1 Tax=Megaselia scalaris TaxID=36166 RepID=T1GLQ1_MEGSC